MPNIEVVSGQQLFATDFGAAEPPEVVLVSPLDVHFSQNVIYPCFSDGRSVDEAVKEVRAVPDESTEEGAADDCSRGLLLQPPFPIIEALWWTPKLRDGDGKPLVDGNGAELRGHEALYTLDNRRLYALQRAAVAQHPNHCRVEVKVLRSREEKARHLKKFRTRTSGLSITISEGNGVGRDNARDFNALRVWDWRSAWEKSAAAGAAGRDGVGGETGKAAAAAEEAAELGSCGCWEYLDPRGACRGPFSNAMLRQWWEHRMLPPDLRIRPFVATDTPGGRAGKDENSGEFRLAVEVFAEAPAPFAPGWSPRAANSALLAGGTDARRECGQCKRQRFEGWSGGGQWYCAACWSKWRENG